MIGTMKQSQLKSTKPTAAKNGMPFCTLMMIIKTVANDVSSESTNWPTYILAIFGFISSTFFFYSSSDIS